MKLQPLRSCCALGRLRGMTKKLGKGSRVRGILLLVMVGVLVFSSAAQGQELRRRHRRHGRKKKDDVLNGAGVGVGGISASLLADSVSGDGCDTKFVKYASSPYEANWVSEINVRELNPCLYILKDVAEQTFMYEITQNAHDKHETNMTRDNLFRVFSMFIYQRTCPNPAENMVFIEPIEPLNGFLRDHRALCPGMMQEMPQLLKPKTGIMDRRFLLISSKTNSPRIFQLHKTSEYLPTLLILDIGAGSFNGAIDGTKNLGDSQAWFMRQFLPKGFRLGKYIAWEEKPMNAEQYFQNLPDEMVTKYTFYNTRITSDPKGKMYPWRFLVEHAHDYDHVVVKMDNNQFAVEMELLQQFAGNPSLMELVDEMFFEFHIRNPPVKEMVPAEGGIIKATLGDAYDLFIKIRQAGVRIHGWP